MKGFGLNVEIADIKDGESLRVWLDALPEDVLRDWMIFIADRSAARIAPLLWLNFGHFSSEGLSDWRLWRSFSIARLAANCPQRKIASHSIASSANALAAMLDKSAKKENSFAATNVDEPDFAELAESAATAASASTAASLIADALHPEHALSNMFSNLASAKFDAWKLAADDFRVIDLLAHPPLWPYGVENQYLSEWREVRQVLESRPDAADWTFWINRYDAMLEGRPMLPDNDAHWQMLGDIFEVSETSRIKEEDWEKGSAHVNPIIREIYESYLAKYDPPPKDDSVDWFVATLFDFTYDEIEAVMRAVPLESDWKTLEDEDRISAFLEDACDLREDMALMCTALQSEGRAMQGAASVATYTNAVLDALQKAENLRAID